MTDWEGCAVSFLAAPGRDPNESGDAELKPGAIDHCVAFDDLLILEAIKPKVRSGARYASNTPKFGDGHPSFLPQGSEQANHSLP